MPSQDESSVIQVPVDSDVSQVLLNTRVVVDDMYMQQGGAFLIGADNIICSHPGKGMPKISRLCTTLHLSADTIITWLEEDLDKNADLDLSFQEIDG